MQQRTLAATYLFHILTNNPKALAGHVVIDNYIKELDNIAQELLRNALTR